MEQEWVRLLNGDSEVSEEKLLSQTAKDLQGLLKAQPQLEEDVLEIVAQRLDGDMDAQTWRLLGISLANYLGVDAVYLIIWLLQSEELPNRLLDLERHAPRQTTAFLRRLLGYYGVELQRAYTRGDELPDNWYQFTREVYYDKLAGTHHIEVRILKYSGEEIFIEGPADSILVLTTNLLLTAGLAGSSDAFRQDVIDGFLDEVGEFLRILPAEQLSEFLDKVQSGESAEQIPGDVLAWQEPSNPPPTGDGPE
jgi:hypothetical protein